MYLLGKSSGRFRQNLSSILHGLKINDDNSKFMICLLYLHYTDCKYSTETSEKLCLGVRTEGMEHSEMVSASLLKIRSAMCSSLRALPLPEYQSQASSLRQLICLILLELKTAIAGLEAGVVLVVVYRAVYCVMCVLCTQPSSSRAHYN